MAKYTRVTLANVLDELSARVGNNTTFWTNTEKRNAFNEAMLIWQALVGEWSQDISILLDGSQFYDIPKQLVGVFRVTYAGASLVPGSISELDYGYPGWKYTTGTPYTFALDGISKIAFYPVPTSGTVIVSGFTEIPLLINTGDYVDIGNEELSALYGYAHHVLTFKESPPESDASFEGLKNLISAAMRRKQQVKATTMYRNWLGKNADEQLRDARVGEGTPGVKL